MITVKRIALTALFAAATVLASPAASMAKDTTWGG